MVEKPWHANFPSPKAQLRSVSSDEVAKLISDPSKVAGKDYVVVDVRRTDFAVPLAFHPLIQTYISCGSPSLSSQTSLIDAH